MKQFFAQKEEFETYWKINVYFLQIIHFKSQLSMLCSIIVLRMAYYGLF